jgi:TRAP-type C4-dicarboxylate transport system permease small subunit
MQKLSLWLNRYANWQSRLCSWALVALGLVMTAVVLAQVFFRFVVYLPLPWSEELARYLMVWMGMLGAVVAQRKGLHIGVRVLVERLPKPLWDRVLAPLVQLAAMAFLLVIFWQGWELTAFNASQLSPAMQAPMYLPYVSIPVGAGMLVINFVSDLLHDRWPSPAGSRADLATPILGGGRAMEI